MREGRRLAAGACLVACLIAPSTTSVADENPSIRLDAPSGTTIGLMSRADGTFPFRSAAAEDRSDCLNDRKVASITALRRVLRTARRDRDAAYVEAMRLTSACLVLRGWVVAFCGGEGEPDCPPPPPPYEPMGEEH